MRKIYCLLFLFSGSFCFGQKDTSDKIDSTIKNKVLYSDTAIAVCISNHYMDPVDIAIVMAFSFFVPMKHNSIPEYSRFKFADAKGHEEYVLNPSTGFEKGEKFIVEYNPAKPWQNNILFYKPYFFPNEKLEKTVGVVTSRSGDEYDYAYKVKATGEIIHATQVTTDTLKDYSETGCCYHYEVRYLENKPEIAMLDYKKLVSFDDARFKYGYYYSQYLFKSNQKTQKTVGTITKIKNEKIHYCFYVKSEKNPADSVLVKKTLNFFDCSSPKILAGNKFTVEYDAANAENSILLFEEKH